MIRMTKITCYFILSHHSSMFDDEFIYHLHIRYSMSKICFQCKNPICSDGDDSVQLNYCLRAGTIKDKTHHVFDPIHVCCLSKFIRSNDKIKLCNDSCKIELSQKIITMDISNEENIYYYISCDSCEKKIRR